MTAKLKVIGLVLTSALAAAAFMATLVLIPGSPRSAGAPSYTQAGHKTDTTRTIFPEAACNDLDAVIHFIELSAAGPPAQVEFFNQMAQGGTCGWFKNKLVFWADEVVVQMEWADGDLMYIVKGHDTHTDPLYIWMTARSARSHGLYPPLQSD